MEVDCKTVKAKLDAGENFLLLDCREPAERSHVCIEGSEFIPMSQLPDRVDELAAFQQSEIIVYCHHGGRSLSVANWLRQRGYANTFSMAGGIDVWAQEIDTSLPRY